ncbi:MAG: amino acid ABC transporter ATP-binding protein [Clostridiales bacterium]|nr:amino acid ABC transporter ATP-binding protein [Clostridiales bacterium]
MLNLTGFYKSFGRTEVLKGVDMSVEKGDIVGVIGSSGSGKSTLLRCINFLERADRGHIELDQVSFDVRNPGKKNILYMRRNTAMVFQQFNLFREKDARENVMLGLIRVQKKPEAEARRIADELLDKVGLSDRKDFFPSQLSGGQQQRVALARAIALDPKVILLDEPTSALDPEMIGEVLDVIRQLANEKRTMVIVSHEMNFIYQICNKVLFMDEGVVLESGTPEEVFIHTKEERTKQFLSRVYIPQETIGAAEKG